MKFSTWNPSSHARGAYPQNWMVELPRRWCGGGTGDQARARQKCLVRGAPHDANTTLTSHACARAKFFSCVWLKSDETQNVWIAAFSVRVISKRIFTQHACHVQNTTWSIFHGTYTEHLDVLFPAVPFKLNTNRYSAVRPICRTLTSHSWVWRGAMRSQAAQPDGVSVPRTPLPAGVPVPREPRAGGDGGQGGVSGLLRVERMLRHGSMVKLQDVKVLLQSPRIANIIFWPRIFGMHSTWMHTERNFYRRVQKNVRITNFFCSNWKITRVWEISRKNSRVASWYGRSREKVCGKILRTGQHKDWAIVQSHVWRTITSRKKNRRRLENCPKCAPQIVLKCLYLARIGRPDIVWSVNKLARAVTKWTRACDRRWARLISHIHRMSDQQTILSCGLYGAALSIGFIPRLRLCWRPWRL